MIVGVSAASKQWLPNSEMKGRRVGLFTDKVEAEVVSLGIGGQADGGAGRQLLGKNGSIIIELAAGGSLKGGIGVALSQCSQRWLECGLCYGNILEGRRSFQPANAGGIPKR